MQLLYGNRGVSRTYWSHINDCLNDLDDYIGNSRDTSFEELVMAKTDGKGVDIILNSLADDKLQVNEQHWFSIFFCCIQKINKGEEIKTFSYVFSIVLICKQASVRCLGYRARFLEIGKFDIVNNSTLGMQFFLRECSFHGIMMDFLFTGESEARQVPYLYVS